MVEIFFHNCVHCPSCALFISKDPPRHSTTPLVKAGYSELFLMKEELQKVLDSIAEFKSFWVTVTQVQQGNGTYEREKKGGEARSRQIGCS